MTIDEELRKYLKEQLEINEKLHKLVEETRAHAANVITQHSHTQNRYKELENEVKYLKEEVRRFKNEVADCTNGYNFITKELAQLEEDIIRNK